MARWRVSLFSRLRPCSPTRVQILSRDTSDGQDEHQRACLHAAVKVCACLEGGAVRCEILTSLLFSILCVSTSLPRPLSLCFKVAQLPGGVVVDVYTTHLSLSERARERTVVEVWDFIQDSRVGHMQVQ